MAKVKSMDFKLIYNTYWQKIYRLCLGYVNDPDQAKDMAQETFIKVWEQLPKFRNEAAIGTWIFRIASNHCLRQIEKDKKMPKTAFPLEIKEHPEQSLENDVKYLYQCISELKEIDRIIISLELEDINQKEIASIVGISESNIRVRIHRIKEKLTTKFKNYER